MCVRPALHPVLLPSVNSHFLCQACNKVSGGPSWDPCPASTIQRSSSLAGRLGSKRAWSRSNSSAGGRRLSRKADNHAVFRGSRRRPSRQGVAGRRFRVVRSRSRPRLDELDPSQAPEGCDRELRGPRSLPAGRPSTRAMVAPLDRPKRRIQVGTNPLDRPRPAVRRSSGALSLHAQKPSAKIETGRILTTKTPAMRRPVAAISPAAAATTPPKNHRRPRRFITIRASSQRTKSAWLIS